MAEFMLFSKALGLNNVLENGRLFYLEGGYSYLQETSDVVIDSSGSVKRRYAFDSVFDGNAHSLWSEGEFCFFVSGGVLRRVLKDMTTVVVLSGISDEPMYFVKEFGKVYASNGVNRFVITDTTVSSWDAVVPTQVSVDTRQLGMIDNFTKMCVHAGRLFVLQGGKYLWQSEPGNFHCFNISDGPLPFEEIHGFVSVETGLYVSCEKGVVFLSGANKATFEKSVAYSLPALGGNFALIDGGAAGKDGEFIKLCAVWGTERGLCTGDYRGVVRDHTSMKVSFPAPITGTIVNTGDYTILSMEV